MAAQISTTIDTCDPGVKQQAPEIYKVGLASVRYLLAVVDLLIGWRLLAQADVAAAALAQGRDEDFYRGKIATAAFFASNMLPALRSIIEAIDDDVTQLPEAAF